MSIEDHKERWAMAAFKRAYYRARVRNIECTIHLLDISTPDICPISGIELDYSNASLGRGRGRLDSSGIRRHGLHYASPSLSRKDHFIGYTPSNIITLSLLANSVQGPNSLEYAVDQFRLIPVTSRIEALEFNLRVFD